MTLPRIDGYTSEGEIPVEGHEPIRIRCDWRAVAGARQRFGKDWSQHFCTALIECDVEKLAEFVELMSHGETSKERVMELSPPLKPLLDAIYGVYMAANLGPDWRQELKKLKKEEDGETATPFGSSTLLRLLSALRRLQASPSPSSGASHHGSSGPSSSSPASNGSGRS